MAYRFFQGCLFKGYGQRLSSQLVAGSLCILGVWLMAPTLEARADVEVSLSGDSLVSLAFPWAGNGLPFSQVVEIQRNSIDPTVVGRMVFDRHGLDSNPVLGLVQAPFASPYPGRMVLISQWGSNNAGCYMEMVLQLGVAGAMQNSQMLIPTEVMLNVGGQVVTLQAQRSEAQFANAQSFQYSEYDSSTSSNVNKTGVWYTGRHLFRISASDAAILSNASAQNVPIRVVLNDRLPITYELGSGTVQRWRSVFNYNPSCGNSGGAVASRSVSTTPPATTSSGYLLRQQGRLSPGGQTLDDGSLFQIVPFEGRAGQAVQILLQSSEFDTYLILVDTEGNVLASNDDISSGNTNSMVRLTLPYTGTYNIIVNAYNSNGSGQYLLTVE